MRIVVDLQACQTEGSAHRGVGRYSRALAEALVAQGDDLDLCLALNGTYPSESAALAREFAMRHGSARLNTYQYPKWSRSAHGSDDGLERVAEDLVVHHWLGAQPDVLHVSHVFEGYVGQAVMPRRLPIVPGVLTSATLFDLIPLRFPHLYLADPAYRGWFESRLATLRQFDLLLAISESSRRDALEFLNLAPESIVTIWGGTSAVFKPGRVSPERQGELRARLGLRGEFVLYTGGDDHRKNLAGAVEGFSRLPGDVRRNVQLIIVCELGPVSREALQRIATKNGLGRNDIVLAGKVAEEDLLDLYRSCAAFVFPSLYEGLGLPVLEAMACGAAAIGGNNSSIAEVIGRGDALFDAQSPQSIACKLAQVLLDKNFAASLRNSGIERAKQFTWEATAARVVEAFREARERKKPTGLSSATALPLKRLALFSPLPPCKSGVADHMQALLPFLARYFEIDLFVDDGYEVSDAALRERYSIFNHSEFPARYRSYDAVWYELGDSQFHAYMLKYLDEFPGIVTLHDAFLSGLYGFIEFYAGGSRSYEAELLRAHGPPARRYFLGAASTNDAVSTSMIALPCTKHVLDSAIGLISHSPFNLQLSRQKYPEGWKAPFRIIKQLVPLTPLPTEQDRREARASLGYGDDDFVVSTFGHVAWTKCGDLLLEGFEQSMARVDSHLKLAFVGELAADEFGHRLEARIKESALRERIVITGFLEESEYRRRLLASDLAFQLRTQSRGGTPKGVLDCMAAGVPVVVNLQGSYEDYPDDVIETILPRPTAADIAACLDRSVADRGSLAARRKMARAYVEAEHHPQKIAAEYALAINEFICRQDSISIAAWATRLDRALPASSGANITTEIARSLSHGVIGWKFERRRLLVDVSHVADSDHGTGIPRVVKNIVKALYVSNRAGFEPVAVRLDSGGHLIPAIDWLESQSIFSRGDRELASGQDEVSINDGDTLLMLDSSWHRVEDFVPLYSNIRARGGRVVTALYDLLPIRLPQFIEPGGPAWFKAWLQKAANKSDALVCISRAVADDFLEFVRSTPGFCSGPLHIGYWHLGANLRPEGKASPLDEVKRAIGRRSFLMVGTLEPRKQHALALAAIENLWRAGIEANLVIVGRKGWLIDDFINRLSSNRELGRRLFYFETLSDDELCYCYQGASALLLPSAGEGFGLPLVEAAQFGLPVLVSDLPAFREVAGEHAFYVETATAEALASSLTQWLSLRARNEHPRSSNIRWKTWDESAEQLLEVVLDNRWYKAIGVPYHP